MTLIADLMRWYGCTEEAAEHIARCAAEHAQQTGQPLLNDLRSIAEAADMPFYVRRERDALPMTTFEVERLQDTFRRLRRKLDEEATAT